ncbi:kinase-like domain-containing protein [Aspergillus minisclerotigenes]|uniref:Kinase-like domain-containing protein n=1 Tax=Aspergillus minisclerotigenes TaxID=656917 RepID=A0A5N6ISG9_9EURO|nr:kinase-like domain-containing protein [Aspergillus minisclerotigenes]
MVLIASPPSPGTPRVANERDILTRFQHSTTHLRPLIEEIQEPAEPPIIILKHLDDHLLNSSVKKALNREELKYVARCILEALSVLHEEGYVHTDVKLDNIFLGDLGGCYTADSEFARSVIMETPWNTATDIWSFGAVPDILGGLKSSRPRAIPYGHEEYNLEVLKQQFRYFGPFPAKYGEIASPETATAILYLMHEIPQSQTTPFSRTTQREVSLKDKEFISGMMKLDWRDRPTAQQLLESKWFED